MATYSTTTAATYQLELPLKDIRSVNMKASWAVVDPINNLAIVVMWIFPALPVTTHKQSLLAAVWSPASSSLPPISLLGLLFSFNYAMAFEERGTGSNGDRRQLWRHSSITISWYVDTQRQAFISDSAVLGEMER